MRKIEMTVVLSVEVNDDSVDLDDLAIDVAMDTIAIITCNNPDVDEVSARVTGYETTSVEEIKNDGH